MKFRRHSNKMCVECRDHHALYRFNAKVRRDKKHTLCFRCFQSLRDAWRSDNLTGGSF
jgi:hypothetical protein